jgi:DNA-directed RNA polymerase subunit N (RpoN/RPB10)
MIIPVRCFNCNKVLGHLWEPYIQKIQEGTSEINVDKEKNYITIDDIQPKSLECKALDDLGVTKYCCRATMMGTVDLTRNIVKTTYSTMI